MFTISIKVLEARNCLKRQTGLIYEGAMDGEDERRVSYEIYDNNASQTMCTKITGDFLKNTDSDPGGPDLT